MVFTINRVLCILIETRLVFNVGQSHIFESSLANMMLWRVYRVLGPVSLQQITSRSKLYIECRKGTFTLDATTCLIHTSYIMIGGIFMQMTRSSYQVLFTLMSAFQKQCWRRRFSDNSPGIVAVHLSSKITHIDNLKTIR